MPVKKKRSPGSQLVRLLWRIPLYSLGAAVFFGTLFGATWRHYRFAYWLSLVFSVCIMLAVWGTEHFLVPALHRAFPRWRSPLQEGLVYMVTSLAGSATAAVIIHHTLLPGFLGGVRQVAMVVMYSLLFGALFTAVAMVWDFHRRSIDHARRDKELELARRIQRGFLPSIFPPSPRVEVHAVNVPSRGVSGDFYDVVPVGNALLLAIADVEGKSMAAALLSTALQASLRTQTPWVGSVAPMVANINVFVCQRHGTAQFATFFLARVDEGAHLTFCNAGHNPPLLLRADGSRLTLDCGGPMLGVVEGAVYEEDALDLRSGDRLIFYTDGITEAANPAGEEFQVERLAALVQSIDSAVSSREVTDRILKAVSDFTEGADPSDDQTLIVVRVRD
jgi:stage II sporulation SpoE-like protein